MELTLDTSNFMIEEHQLLWYILSHAKSGNEIHANE